MHSIETIKKLNGEFPIFLGRRTEEKPFISLPLSIIRELKEKADKYDAYLAELRAEPLRKNQ